MTQKCIQCLIVDDDAYISDFLKIAIEDLDVTVDVVNNGQDALELLIEGKSIDILITDLNMPGLHGQELVEKVRKISPKTLIIVITGYGGVDSAVSLIKEGAFDYLTKPIELDVFLDSIEKAIANVKASQKKKVIQLAKFGTSAK